ncbi:MAG: DUF2141 domain-containing protein [Sinimarinibacterium sp.]|jgi:uncharacterized protein (DUF2141 family)
MQRLTILVLVAATCAWLVAADVAQAASLEVNLEHLRPAGTVRVQVFADAQSWASGRQPIASRIVAARGVSQVVSIDGLAPGRYAVRADQDAIDFEQVPLLALARRGVSGNNAFCNRRGPAFERTSVAVGSGASNYSIHMFICNNF